MYQKFKKRKRIYKEKIRIANILGPVCVYRTDRHILARRVRGRCAVASSNARVCSLVAIIWIKCATTSAVRRPRLESFLYFSATRKGGNNLLRENNKCVVDGGLVPLSLSFSLFLFPSLVPSSLAARSFTPRVHAAYRTVHTRVFSVSPRFMSLDGRADLEDRSFVRLCVLCLVRRGFWPPFARVLRRDKYRAAKIFVIRSSGAFERKVGWAWTCVEKALVTFTVKDRNSLCACVF